MKPRLPLILFLAAALGLAGCSTVDKRIEEKSAAFAAYPAEIQENLRKGIVEIGYTPDQVYIALEEYRGTALVGYRRRIAYHPVAKRNYVYWEPAMVDVYRGRIDERIRISFQDGKVAVIEQAKD